MKSTKGFTIVELLTVIAVSALLLSLLIPSLRMARNMARDAKQKVQFSAIDQALLAWRNDFGDYPPSFWDHAELKFYCGAQKLAEALFGLDLLGFQPDSSFNYDGFTDLPNPVFVYDVQDPILFAKRKARYLDMDNIDVFQIGDIYQDFGQLAPNTYVLCDVYGHSKINGVDGVIRAGLPILYYKADTSKTQFTYTQDLSVYSSADNFQIILTQQVNDERIHPLLSDGGNYFYSGEYEILDKKVLSKPWPHRPDSYILISAGIDGLYGTNDDITNFGY